MKYIPIEPAVPLRFSTLLLCWPLAFACPQTWQERGLKFSIYLVATNCIIIHEAPLSLFVIIGKNSHPVIPVILSDRIPFSIHLVPAPPPPFPPPPPLVRLNPRDVTSLHSHKLVALLLQQCFPPSIILIFHSNSSLMATIVEFGQP